MSERTILHCDLNNFFASVECFHHPELKNVPMAVCGSVEERHGIVLAKNEQAKKYGVKTAQPVWQAKLVCPELVIAEPHYDEYLRFSLLVRKIYEEYTDLVEPFGIDECWLDVTGSQRLFGSGEKIAQTLRRRIKKEIGLTISVGVSFNKVFAKLGSDLKKPDAVTVIPKDSFKEIVWPLKIEEMIGVGRSTKQRLNSVGIYTLGELAACDEKELNLLLGKAGIELCQNAKGLNNSPVLSQSLIPPAKSFGRSMTCRCDLVNEEQVKSVMLYLADKVARSLRENGAFATLVQISVRDTSLVTREKQCVIDEPTRLVQKLFSCGMQLFNELWSWQDNIRSVGIRAAGLVGEKCSYQYSLFSNAQKTEKLERLENQIFKIRENTARTPCFVQVQCLFPALTMKTLDFQDFMHSDTVKIK
ncbi:MAG: DNA polymerase IV [Acutalibacteraceae bacterium]